MDAKTGLTYLMDELKSHEELYPVNDSPGGIGYHLQFHLEGWRFGAKMMETEHEDDDGKMQKYQLGS